MSLEDISLVRGMIDIIPVSDVGMSGKLVLSLMQDLEFKKLRVSPGLRAVQDFGPRSGLGFHGGSYAVGGAGDRGGIHIGRTNSPRRAIEHSVFIRCRGAPRAIENVCKG